MNLFEWSRAWGVPDEAVLDLMRRMGTAGDGHLPAPAPLAGSGLASEALVQSRIRLEAAQCGVWLTRNNVGALLDKRGVPVRYGLCNESPAQNEKVKSSDLVGIRPLRIGPEHNGMLIGQFIAREIKEEGWRFNAKDPHEAAQLAFINFVISKGGDAAFACGPGSF